MGYLEAVEPPKQLYSVLPCDTPSGLVEVLRQHHGKRSAILASSPAEAAAAARVPTKAELQLVLEEDPQAADQIRKVYERKNLSEAGKIAAIQSIVRISMDSGLPSPLAACDELTEMLEAKASDTRAQIEALKSLHAR